MIMFSKLKHAFSFVRSVVMFSKLKDDFSFVRSVVMFSKLKDAFSFVRSVVMFSKLKDAFSFVRSVVSSSSWSFKLQKSNFISKLFILSSKKMSAVTETKKSATRDKKRKYKTRMFSLFSMTMYLLKSSRFVLS